MEIRTKFKPKDKIWTIDYVIEDGKKVWFVEPEQTQIAYIVINDGITYYTMDCEYHNERNCFTTKEEAQKECDLRNGAN